MPGDPMLRNLELFDLKAKSEGERILKMIDDLTISQHTLDKNYQELLMAFTIYEYEHDLWSFSHWPKYYEFVKDFSRLLHNYLASVLSLRDHTIKFRDKKLKNSQFNEAYDEKLKKLELDKFSKFLIALRTYTQHSKIPHITGEISIKEINGEKKVQSFKEITDKTKSEEFEKRLTISKKDLLDWDSRKPGRLNKDVKEYLKRFDKNNIDLKEVLSEYQHAITIFYDWIYQKVIEIYSKEIFELLEIEREMRALEATYALPSHFFMDRPYLKKIKESKFNP